MIIDAHTHAYLPQDLEVLIGRLEMLDSALPDNDPNKWSLKIPGDLDGLLEAQARAGVDRMVLLPVSAKAQRPAEMSRWAAQAASQHPQIIPFGLLHPHGEMEKDLEIILDLGLKGVKLHPFLQRFQLQEPASRRMFTLLEEAGLVVLTDSMSLQGVLAAKPHVGWAMETMGFVGNTPEQIAQLARSHPRLKIIAAHGGSLYGWDLLEPLFELDNVYLDLANLKGLLEPDRLLKIMARKGMERIIYGSDAPWRDPARYLDWFDGLGLGPYEKEMVLAGNILSLLE